MTIRMHRRENHIRTGTILHIPFNLDSVMGGGDLESPLGAGSGLHQLLAQTVPLFVTHHSQIRAACVNLHW